MSSIAIIGAGFGGLCAAHTLLAQGAHTVTLLDKGYFPGGRLATRRSRGQDTTFDHGAQYFTAKTPSFQRLVRTWQTQHIVQPWEPRLVVFDALHEPPRSPSHDAQALTRWVGTPHMNALAAHLAAPLDVRTQHRVTGITHEASSYTLTCATPDGARALSGFDAIILNLPPVQALDLLNTLHAPPHSLLETLQGAPEMEPCWAWMGLFEPGTLDPGFDAAFVNAKGSALSWIAVNSAKPERSRGADALLLHASVGWSKAHLEEDPTFVQSALLDAMHELVGAHQDIPSPLSTQVHRWRYARPAEQDDAHRRSPPARCDAASRIALCGDWLEGGRVEGAFLAGVKAALHLTGRADLDPTTMATW